MTAAQALEQKIRTAIPLSAAMQFSIKVLNQDEIQVSAPLEPNINVHGTSTPLGDIAESKAIIQVFGEHAYDLSISSTKSMTGHLLGAAGAIEALATLMSVKEDIIPPTINFQTKDEDIDQKLDLTLNKAKKRTVRAALSNTFGFGGHNASVIFKKAE